MSNCITWVGLDDSANKINVAIFHGQEMSPREELVAVNDNTGLGRLAKKLKAIKGEVRCVYEAGINGYHLQRFFSKHGISCDIAAPSLTPRRAGKRVKTDRLDAKTLGKLYRAGELTSIAIPEKEQESLRDLIRAREDCSRESAESATSIGAVSNEARNKIYSRQKLVAGALEMDQEPTI